MIKGRKGIPLIQLGGNDGYGFFKDITRRH